MKVKENKQRQEPYNNLWIVNTRTCNFNCIYCYQGSHKWTWQKDCGLVKNMNMDVIRATLPWVIEWAKGTKSVRTPFYGGEPLVNFKLVKQAVPLFYQALTVKGYKYSWGVTTNGSLMTDEVMHFIELYGGGILLSLDGPPWNHNKQRVYYGNRPTWDDIPTKELLARFPRMEIAWQLDPSNKVTWEDVEWMIDYGFHYINFNINWNAEWSADAQVWLQDFCQNLSRACIQTVEGIRPEKEGIHSNLFGKFRKATEAWAAGTEVQEKPCGTNVRMLALTPEGWLYPSQEMAFNALEPDRAPGTAEYYRIGNVFNDPVLVSEADQKRINDIRVDEMEPPEGYDCRNCVARPISFGGCHCRYVGQGGQDPAQRHQVEKGYCPAMASMLKGMLAGASIENYLAFNTKVSQAKMKAAGCMGCDFGV
jgi:radical SAM protein with 4Fe4S-binding SPASM domain